ncbi:alpha/beta hydrolase [bacterium]|nr:alpha/beta hydrolase [bacterium]
MFIKIDEVKVYYEVKGQGKSVILLHGWGGQAASFLPVLDFLSQTFAVYALDLPGFGRSSIPPTAWGSNDYALFIYKFLSKLEIAKADLIGHSFGGRIALSLAANFPEKVGKLILVDSAGIRPKRTAKYYLRVLMAKTGKRLVSLPLFGKGLKNAIYNRIGSKDYREAGNMRTTLIKVVNEDLRHLLVKIKAPTLLIWGENDMETPISHARIMERQIEDAGLVILKGAGHFSYLDNLAQFCLIASNFLGECQDVT